ncbi:MAG: hypothetical protein ACE368_10405 [Paracoccaceae bacterium]
MPASPRSRWTGWHWPAAILSIWRSIWAWRPPGVDGTPVGGCSFLMHVRHAAAAIRAGYCQTVLVVHGESGRSRIGKPPPPFPPDPTSLAGQFEAPFGGIVPPTMFTVPVLRYLHTHGLTPAALAEVVVAQRRWAALNPRAKFKEQLTVDQVLADRPIAWPFTLPMCCPQTDGGGGRWCWCRRNGRGISRADPCSSSARARRRKPG